MSDDGDGIYGNAGLHVNAGAVDGRHSALCGTDTILFYGPDAVGG
jgi:hypothetical protein